MPEPIEFSKPLQKHETNIPGLIWFDLPLHGDNRGWFKENWQREKMLALGLPDFGPIQNNISYNEHKGVTRGIHAEPWDKYISVASGRIFGAWVDLREGDGFGKVFTLEIGPSKAIFVPRGVGNAYQALEDGTAYTYLVNDHWSAENRDYAFLNLADATVDIPWPIPLNEAELSDKDKIHPDLNQVQAIKPKRILITGANGQLAKALEAQFPEGEVVDHNAFDITDPSLRHSRNWRQYRAIINGAAYTNVDDAESPEGRVAAWQTNAVGVANLARIAEENKLILVHISSDYVFDGTKAPHDEEEPYSPLNVYGHTKAAGDVAAATAPFHYIIRTSWVIGEGKNFVLTMKGLGERDVNPEVVNDQIGRLAFTQDIAAAIHHLLQVEAPYGTYNVTSSGKPASWAEVAQKVFELNGHDPSRVKGISTMKYFKDKPSAAIRPLQSTLDLSKIEAAGFSSPDWEQSLEEYLQQLSKKGTRR